MSEFNPKHSQHHRKGEKQYIYSLKCLPANSFIDDGERAKQRETQCYTAQPVIQMTQKNMFSSLTKIFRIVNPSN